MYEKGEMEYATGLHSEAQKTKTSLIVSGVVHLFSLIHTIVIGGGIKMPDLLSKAISNAMSSAIVSEGHFLRFHISLFFRKAWLPAGRSCMVGALSWKTSTRAHQVPLIAKALCMLR